MTRQPWVRTPLSRPFLVLALLLAAGCSNSEDQGKLDVAMQSVQAGLETWKRGERPAAIKSEADPIEFFDDDWEKSARLVDYKLGQTYIETDGTARCAVELTVQHGKKPQTQVRVTYQVVNKDNKTVIARDPFS